MPGFVEVLPTSSDDDEVVAPPQAKAEVPATAADASPATEADATPHGAQAGGDDEQLPEGADASDVVTVDLEECNRFKLQGNKLFGEGKVDEALATYRKAILKAPIKPIQRPKRSAAATAAADAVEDDAVTSDHDDRDGAGHAENASGSEKSASAPEKTEDEEPEDTTDYTLTSQVFCNAGYCLMKLEVYDEAVELLSEAIRHDETYQKAYLRRAESYFHLEKWSSAYGDYESYTKLGGTLDAPTRARCEMAKKKTDEEMQKMLGDLKELGNRFLGTFGLSTDMFKFDKDPNTGGYSMRFERN